jgi:hypothetical protein
MKAVLAAVAVAVLLYPRAAVADIAGPIPMDATAIMPATRLDPPEPEPVLEAPPGSRCPELYAVAVEHWPGAVLHWPVLDKIFWRESRCHPQVVNRYGCVGLMQICRINHARLGVTRSDLQEAGTNIEIGYQLCLEQQQRGRSCWRPWWLGRWRP